MEELSVYLFFADLYADLPPRVAWGIYNRAFHFRHISFSPELPDARDTLSMCQKARNIASSSGGVASLLVFRALYT